MSFCFEEFLSSRLRLSKGSKEPRFDAEFCRPLAAGEPKRGWVEEAVARVGLMGLKEGIVVEEVRWGFAGEGTEPQTRSLRSSMCGCVGLGSKFVL